MNPGELAELAYWHLTLSDDSHGAWRRFEERLVELADEDLARPAPTVAQTR